jgi:hypothetical protein
VLNTYQKYLDLPLHTLPYLIPNPRATLYSAAMLIFEVRIIYVSERGCEKMFCIRIYKKERCELQNFASGSDVPALELKVYH